MRRALTTSIYIEEGEAGRVYAATNGGVFAIHNGHAEKVFFSNDPLERKCRSVIKSNDRLVIGTDGGLFIKAESEAEGRKVSGHLENQPIYRLNQDPQYIYAVTSAKVYRIEKQSGAIKEIYSTGPEPEVFMTDEPVEEAEALSRSIGDIAISRGEPPVLFVIGERGVFTSTDAGETWQPFPQNISFESALSLVVTNLRENAGADVPLLAAGTSQGIYTYQNNHWQPLYKGLPSHQAYRLAFRNQKLFAATDSGLFVTPFPDATQQSASTAAHTYQQLSDHFAHEPTISEIQEMAIRYAEVHPNKIRNWRKEARMKTLLPSVSVGVDRSATELLHWDTGPNPDNLQKGKEFVDWDASISWDFADLIWSTDQTTIDSRSKLMVELREDVLDQVTRLYFERRRLQFELLGPSGVSDSTVDKEMRIAELTALLDGFTGGQFSQEIKHAANEQFSRKE